MPGRSAGPDGCEWLCKSYIQASITLKNTLVGESLRWAAAIYMLLRLSAWPSQEGACFDDFTMSVLHLSSLQQ